MTALFLIRPFLAPALAPARRAPRAIVVRDLVARGLVARAVGVMRNMMASSQPVGGSGGSGGSLSGSPSTSGATVPHSSHPQGPSHKPVDEEARAREARLLERCRGGDLEAFDELVASHQNKIFNLCCWMLGDRDEAGDAAQDAFVRAWRAIGNFRADAAFGTWMHRIAVNVCLDARARRAKAPITYSALEKPGEDGEGRAFDPPDKADTPDKAVARREKRQAVLEALAALPEHHRAVVVLFDIQGYSYEDAAQALDLPMGTLKSRLNRARAALRRALEGQRELFED